MHSLYSILHQQFEDPDRIIQELWHQCLETIPGDSAESQVIFQAIREFLSPLSPWDIDRVISLICTLCSEHEYQGFFYGLRNGAQLMDALKNSSSQKE